MNSAIVAADYNPHKEATLTLNRMEIGQRGRVTQLAARSDVHHRLMEMGLIRGATVELVRLAPLGDPMDIKVRGYHLSLRKEDAKLVEVELLKEPASASPASGAGETAP
jgi:Fe2+ transport system protein FeoA